MSATTGSGVVHQYRLDPTRFARVRRRMITYDALVAPLFLAVMWYLDARFERHVVFFDFLFLPGIIAWTSYRELQQERKKWESLVLELRDDKLIRTLPDFPAIEISPDDVAAIVESSSGIIVRTNSRRNTLAVSADLLDYGDFRNRLADWAPMANRVQPAPYIRRVVTNIVSALCCVLLFGGPLYLMYTPYHEVILPLGAGLFIGMAAMVWYYQRSPMMPTSFRKRSWILLLLPLIATISRLMESR